MEKASRGITFFCWRFLSYFVVFGEQGGGRRGFQSVLKSTLDSSQNSFLVPLFLTLYLSNQQDLELVPISKGGDQRSVNNFYIGRFASYLKESRAIGG
jgi:hypothetical protein